METKEKRRVDGKRSQTGRKPAAQRPQNSAPKKRSVSGASSAKGEIRHKTDARMRTAQRKRRATKPQPSPDVVYTQPTPFNKDRFVLNLLIVGAVVLALIFGMSIFFKVEKITISGANKYSAKQIEDATGLKGGENLLSISEPRIAKIIQDALRYVDKVRVGIKLPNTVKIEIVELAVVYSVECIDGSWWLISSEGNIIEKTNDADAGRHTKILGVKLADPALGEKATAAQPEETVPDGEVLPEGETQSTEETSPVTVLPQEQLDMAITIAENMESAGIIGEATSIDVTNLSDLQIWYGERFQVLLGDSMELNYKIRTMKATLEQMDDYQGGVLDISFTTWPNEVGYTPFS